MLRLLVLIPVVLVILILAQAQRKAYVLQYLYFVRMPALFAIALAVVLPLATLVFAPHLLGNLIDVRPWGTFAIALTATYTAWVVYLTAGRSLEIAPIAAGLRYRRSKPAADVRLPLIPALGRGLTRFLGWVARITLREAPRGQVDFGALALYLVLAAPIIVLTVVQSGRQGHFFSHLGAAALGILAALALRGLAELLDWSRDGNRFSKYLEAGQTPFVSNALHNALDLFRKGVDLVLRLAGVNAARLIRFGIRPEKADAALAQLRRNNERAAAVMLVTAFFFIVLASWSRAPTWIPALAIVLTLISLLCLAWSFLPVILDKRRIPVFLLLAVGLMFLYWNLGVDYTYDLRSDNDAQALSVAEVYDGWRTTHPTDSVVTVVTASGGGITAGRWLVDALAAIQRRDSTFKDSILLISAVSGGAFGAMYFVDHVYESTYLPPASDITRCDSTNAVGQAQCLSGESSLIATAHGLVFVDFWRWLPGLNQLLREDRGRGIERLWRERLADSSATLRSWGRDNRTGTRPVVLFNGTVAETGERFVMSAVDFNARAVDFVDLYPNHDLSVATAARLSATFPFVSPLARPRSCDAFGEDKPCVPEERAYHIGDGGYFDNGGTASAIDFMDEFAAIHTQRSTGPLHVLWIKVQMAGFSREAGNHNLGWKYSTYGPLSTLTKVRTATQASRNEIEVDLLKRALEPTGVFLYPLLLDLGGAGPLSWHLTPKDVLDIEQAGAESCNKASRLAVITVLQVGPTRAKQTLASAEACWQRQREGNARNQG